MQACALVDRIESRRSYMSLVIFITSPQVVYGILDAWSGSIDIEARKERGRSQPFQVTIKIALLLPSIFLSAFLSTQLTSLYLSLSSITHELLLIGFSFPVFIASRTLYLISVFASFFPNSPLRSFLSTILLRNSLIIYLYFIYFNRFISNISKFSTFSSSPQYTAFTTSLNAFQYYLQRSQTSTFIRVQKERSLIERNIKNRRRRQLRLIAKSIID